MDTCSIMRRRMMMGGGEQTPVTVGSYTINQTKHTTSANMISVSAACTTVINAIHAASHLYVCELVNGVLQCKQLSDTNKLQWVDGTTATISDTQDVMMKLPQFWWKCVPDAENDDIADISFTMVDPEDNTWHEWAGNIFIGAYKGLVIDSKLHSRSGLVAGGYSRVSLNGYKTYAANKGAGFTCLTYEMTQIIALLGFGRLKKLTPRPDFNIGASYSSSYTTGHCDALGMEDGKVGNYSSFWGIEDYITAVGLGEFIHNLTFSSGNIINIKNPLNTSQNIRSVQCAATLSGNNYFTKIVLGTNGDILPKATTTSKPGNSVGYGGYCNVNNQGFYHANVVNNSNTTFVPLTATTAAGSAVNYVTSRLQYQGDYTIIQ